MGGGQPAHTTQTTEVKLPAWVDKASQSNYDLAAKLAGRPLQQWAGQDVVAPSAMTNQGYGILSRGAGSETPMYNKAAGMYDEARGLYEKSTRPFDPTPYLNPYTGEVESRAISNAERALQTQLDTAGDAARKAGAFGGSASAIQQGVLAAEGARGIGDLSAELRRAGYDKATADMLADRAGMRDAAAGITSTGGALTTTADARQRARMADVSGLLGAGSQEQKQRQAVLDAQKARFYEKRDYPLEGLNLRLSALGMSPYGKTENIDKTETSEKQGMDFGTIFGGLMQMIPMFMGLSDRRLKKDIKRVGTQKTTGLPTYSYRFKGTPKKSPKMVGPMAQDVEKKYPGAVREVRGKKMVPMGILTAP